MEFFGKDVDDISANDDHTARLDLSPLAKGLYIATVVTAHGAVKLIKK